MAKRRKWTELENNQLLLLRFKGNTWDWIAKQMDRTEKACETQHSKLKLRKFAKRQDELKSVVDELPFQESPKPEETPEKEVEKPQQPIRREQTPAPQRKTFARITRRDGTTIDFFE